MLRLLLTLIAANLLALLWWQGALDSIVGSGRDPERVRQQVDADRLRVVPLDRLKNGAAPGQPNPSAQAGANPSAAANPSAGATAPPNSSPGAPPVASPPSGIGQQAGTGNGTAASSPAATTVRGADNPDGADKPAFDQRTAACQQLAPLEEAAVARARSFFGEHPRYFVHEVQAFDEGPPQWHLVTVPSENLEAAQRKFADFKRQGFDDFTVLLEGPYRYGLSFGKFRSEQAARRLMEALDKRGVRSMRILPPRAAGAPARSTLRYRYPADALPPKVGAGLASLLKEIAVVPASCDAAARP